ncbi:NUDIX domain-containing protein [Fredinandcohnia sp. 179-A 10B2 NHS]|uniref:NUDIX domain-containing protein n=1 Tax=Fredinandcohnia sp. 179-A 10B2 NHS TaxID=3235176 RepID=UPI0039A0B9CA
MVNTKNNGFEFIEFIVREDELIDFSSLAGSYAVIQCEGNYLLCYNTMRSQWEIPAGRREANETAKECAIRELYEETGQSVTDMHFKGLLKVRNVSNGNIKYNPVYFAVIDTLQPFIQNNETSCIHLWDLKEQIGYIDEVDFRLLNFLNSSRRRIS